MRDFRGNKGLTILGIFFFPWTVVAALSNDRKEFGAQTAVQVDKVSLEPEEGYLVDQNKLSDHASGLLQDLDPLQPADWPFFCSRYCSPASDGACKNKFEKEHLQAFKDQANRERATVAQTTAACMKCVPIGDESCGERQQAETEKATEPPPPAQVAVWMLKTEDCPDGIYAISDIEGAWGYWANFVMTSGVFEVEANTDMFGITVDGKRYKLHGGKCLVFVGDSLDSGPRSAPDFPKGVLKPITISDQLVRLYEKYSLHDGAVCKSPRVMLVLGNRDVNKLRFKTELRSDAAPDNFPYYWLANTKKNGDSTCFVTFEECMTTTYSSSLFPPPAGGGETTNPCLPKWTNAVDEPSSTKVGVIMKDSMGANGAEQAYMNEINNICYGFNGLARSELVPGLCDTNDLAAQLLHLLSPGQVFYKFIQYAVVIGLAVHEHGKTSSSYTVFAHAGLDPGMFHNDEFVAPKADINRPQRCSEVQFKGLHIFDRKIMDAFPHGPTDLQSCMELAGETESWAAAWASWKNREFADWSQDNGANKNAMNRPGGPLIDLGLGVWGGTWRNSGFWLTSPIGAWEYGVNTLTGGTGSLTYKNERSPLNLATKLKTRRIRYLVVGHFTESGGGKQIAEMFKMGGEDLWVVNLDVSNPSGTPTEKYKVWSKLQAFTKIDATGTLTTTASSELYPEIVMKDEFNGRVFHCPDSKGYAVIVGGDTNNLLFKMVESNFGSATYKLQEQTSGGGVKTPLDCESPKEVTWQDAASNFVKVETITQNFAVCQAV